MELTSPTDPNQPAEQLVQVSDLRLLLESTGDMLVRGGPNFGLSIISAEDFDAQVCLIEKWDVYMLLGEKASWDAGIVINPTDEQLAKVLYTFCNGELPAKTGEYVVNMTENIREMFLVADDEDHEEGSKFHVDGLTPIRGRTDACTFTWTDRFGRQFSCTVQSED